MLGLTLSNGETPKIAIKRLDVTKLISQMKNKASSHMVEALVAACPPELYEGLWAKLKPSFAALCLNPVANFAAQSLIASATDSRFVTEMFHEVKGNLTDVILNRRSGVAVLLLASCAAHSVCAVEVCQAVVDAVGSEEVRTSVVCYM